MDQPCTALCPPWDLLGLGLKTEGWLMVPTRLNDGRFAPTAPFLAADAADAVCRVPAAHLLLTTDRRAADRCTEAGFPVGRLRVLETMSQSLGDGPWPGLRLFAEKGSAWLDADGAPSLQGAADWLLEAFTFTLSVAEQLRLLQLGTHPAFFLTARLRARAAGLKMRAPSVTSPPLDRVTHKWETADLALWRHELELGARDAVAIRIQRLRGALEDVLALAEATGHPMTEALKQARATLGEDLAMAPDDPFLGLIAPIDPLAED
jgi:hypothetical protein